MTDDGFIFGNESDDDDETALFGTRSGDESTAETAAERARRFRTTTSADTDSWSFVQRVRATVSGETIRTATAVALVAVLVVALGLVAYPLVMGTLDTGERSTGGAEQTTDGGAGFAGSTEPSLTTPMAETMTEQPTATTAVPTSETATLTTTATTTPSPSPTPTPTERTTTPAPTRAFPAGEPADENETNESASLRASPLSGDWLGYQSAA